MAIRQFDIEGGLHLYSSLPTAICPANLYDIELDPELQAAVADCNIYLIVCRRRIAIDPRLEIEAGHLVGQFLTQAERGWAPVPFRYPLLPVHHAGAPDQLQLATTVSGSHIRITNVLGQQHFIASHVLVASAESGLGEAHRDLDVMYVGQGFGRIRPRTSVDRLLRHDKLPRILARMHTYQPEIEVLLLLYRFEHKRVLASNAGDLTLEPEATEEEEKRHLSQITSAKIDRKGSVDLAEAALINFFQPPYNVLLRDTDFAAKKKIKALEKVLAHDLTGLMVEICTSNLHSRLSSEACRPVTIEARFPELFEGYRRLIEAGGELGQRAKEELTAMEHTHIAPFPLTNVDERETFLHGIRWKGQDVRMPFL